MLKIQENIKLAPFTAFGVGGPAKYFIEIEKEEDLIEALKFAKEKRLPIFILGGGSNVLVSDQGVDGLVIKFKALTISKNADNLQIKIARDDLVECWGGESLASVVNFAKKNDLAGLEWAIGIPGMIGGAVSGNAGAYGESMANIVEKVRVVKIGQTDFEIKNFLCRDCEFGYRNSIFKRKPELVVISVILKLKKDDKNKIQNRMKGILDCRNARIPKGIRNAGSFFLNPVVKEAALREKFEKDSGKKVQNKTVPAGWLIEEAGLSGKKIGGAMVSEKHANFIVNTGNATAQDIVMLSSIIKQKVRNKFNVQLMEEVKLLGF
jgi:UDP-N-acetylmuramate dehydrogenase